MVDVYQVVMAPSGRSVGNKVSYESSVDLTSNKVKTDTLTFTENLQSGMNEQE